MHRTILRAAVLAVALLVTAPAAAALADTLPRNFAYRVQSAEQRFQWTELSEGAPDKCRSWSRGRGTVTIKVPAYTGLLKLDESYSGQVTGYSDSESLRAMVERRVDFLGHTAPEEGCTPCGQGEYGPCAPSVEDRTVIRNCPRTASARPYLRATPWSILFAPGADAITALRSCSQLRWPVSDSTFLMRFAPITARRGTGKLLRLKIGQQTTLVFKSRPLGRCSQLGRRGTHVCATATAKIKFRRTF